MAEPKRGDETRLHLNPLLPLLRSTLVQQSGTYKQDLLSCSGSHSLPPPSSSPRQDENGAGEATEGRRKNTLLSSTSATSPPSVAVTSPRSSTSTTTTNNVRPALSLRMLGLTPMPDPRLRRDSKDDEKNEDDRQHKAKSGREVRILEVNVVTPTVGDNETGTTAAVSVDDGEEGGGRKVRVRRGSFSRTQDRLRLSFRYKLRVPKTLGGEGEHAAGPVVAAPVVSDPSHSFHVSEKQLFHIELDGGVLYVVSQDKVCLYDTESRGHMYSIDAVARRITVFDHILYYANRTTASSTERDVIVAWNTKLRQVTHIFKGHEKWITSLFVHDKVLYSCATDHTCRCWNVVRWNKQGFTTARPQLSPKQTANTEERVEEALKLWVELFQKAEAESARKTSVSREEAFTGVSMPTELRVYRDDDAVTSAAICNERKLLFTASPTQFIRAWTLAGNQCVGKYAGHTDWVYGVKVHGGVLYSCSRDQTIRSWNIDTFECTQVYDTATNNLNTKKFFVAGGVLFVICDDFVVRLFNTRTGKVIRELEGHTGPIRCMVLFQRELFTASGDGSVRRWHFKKGLELAVYKGHTAGITSITIDEQRRLLYSAGQDGLVCVWDLSDAADKANKQISDTDGELMQYKRRIDDIIQRQPAIEPDASDKAPPPLSPIPADLIKVRDHVLQMIQQEDDSASPSTSPPTSPPTSPLTSPPTSPPTSPSASLISSPLSQSPPGIASTFLPPPQFVTLTSSSSPSMAANAGGEQKVVKNKGLKAGFLKLARGDSWRIKAKGKENGRDDGKECRKLHTSDAIMTEGRRGLLAEGGEKEKKAEEGKAEDGKAGGGGATKMREHLYRLGSTFSFERRRKEKREHAVHTLQQQQQVKRSASEGEMPSIPAHKDRIQWLPEDKYSSGTEEKTRRASIPGSRGEEEAQTVEGKKDQESKEFDILGWMEERITQDDADSAPRQRTQSKEGRETRAQETTSGQRRTSDGGERAVGQDGKGKPPSAEEVESEIEGLVRVAMNPFADISYVDFGAVLYKVISLCMGLCSVERRTPSTNREATGADVEEEGKRVRNDLRLALKEFTRHGVSLLQHVKRKALAKEDLTSSNQPEYDELEAFFDRQDEGSERKAFLTAVAFLVAAVKQLARWWEGVDSNNWGGAGRTKSESESEERTSDASPTEENESESDSDNREGPVEVDATQALFDNLECQCCPETLSLLAEVRKPLDQDPMLTGTDGKNLLALHLSVFAEMVGLLKQAADGDDVPSSRWDDLAGRHLLVLIQVARAVARDSPPATEEGQASSRQRGLLVMECAVIVKASETLRCAKVLDRLLLLRSSDTTPRGGDGVDAPDVSEGSGFLDEEAYARKSVGVRALLRQKSGQLLAAVVQLLATVRQECA